MLSLRLVVSLHRLPRYAADNVSGLSTEKAEASEMMSKRLQVKSANRGILAREARQQMALMNRCRMKARDNGVVNLSFLNKL